MDIPQPEPQPDEFDQFLQDSLVEDARRQEMEKYREEFNMGFDAALKQANVEMFNHPDPVIAAEIQSKAIAEVIETLLATIEIPTDMENADFVEHIRIEATEIVSVLALKEESLLVRMKLLIVAHEAVSLYNPDFDTAAHYERKREFLADMIASGDHSPVDDPLFTFANHIIPGAVVDFSLSENEEALVLSLERFMHKSDDSEKNRLIFEELMDILKSDTEADELDLIPIVGEMMISAVSEPSSHEREARIFSIARSMQGTNVDVSAVLSLLEQKFPTKN